MEMKKRMVLVVAAVLALAMFAMSSCEGSVFSMDSADEKSMNIMVENAGADEFAMSGGLVVGEGEAITVSSDLEKGSVRIEIYKQAEEQSMEEVEIPEGEPVMTFDASGTDSSSADFEPGDYTVKATVLEKATGAVKIDVAAAN